MKSICVFLNLVSFTYGKGAAGGGSSKSGPDTQNIAVLLGNVDEIREIAIG
jgi:hypothetical protein